MTQIQPYSLWIGHAGEARDYERIADAGIEALVNLAAEEKCDRPPRELLYLRFPLIDGIGNRSGWLDLAVTSVANLLRLRVPTLVYCGAGRSQSPVIAASALAVAFRANPEDCLRHSGVTASQRRVAWLLGRGESRARQEGKMKGVRGPYPRWAIGREKGKDVGLQPIMPLRTLPVKVRSWELTVYPRSHIRR